MIEDIDLIEHAAALLDAEALSIRECHNLDHRNPDWSGEEEAKRQHDDFRNTSTKLYELADRMKQAAPPTTERSNMNITDYAVIAPGTPLAGGFFAGLINIDGKPFALIAAPKAEGERKDVIWIDDYKDVPGAKSYFDGLVNTNAMAEAGSELAQWARGLRISGHDDWYLPSQDELEIAYRNLKPTTEENYAYNRSGMNLSAVEPTRSYTPEFPAQTQADAFKAGGEQAFDDRWYWSSTQHASVSDYAWSQYFLSGHQDYHLTFIKLRARAVRRLPI